MASSLGAFQSPRVWRRLWSDKTRTAPNFFCSSCAGSDPSCAAIVITQPGNEEPPGLQNQGAQGDPATNNSEDRLARKLKLGKAATLWTSRGNRPLKDKGKIKSLVPLVNSSRVFFQKHRQILMRGFSFSLKKSLFLKFKLDD
jgi:hypothetical protein